MKATDENIIDEDGLRLLGLGFGAVTAAVVLIAVLLMREHLEGRLNLLL